MNKRKLNWNCTSQSQSEPNCLVNATKEIKMSKYENVVRKLAAATNDYFCCRQMQSTNALKVVILNLYLLYFSCERLAT